MRQAPLSARQGSLRSRDFSFECFDVGNTLGRTRSQTNFFLLERILNSPYRTHDPEQADFFFIPTFDLCLSRARTSRSKLVAWAVSYVRDTWPYWDRSGGKNHLLVTADDQGQPLAPCCDHALSL